MRKEGRRGKEGDGREMSQKKRGQIRHLRTFCSVLEVFTRQPVSSPSEAHTPSRPPSAQGCDQQPASPNDALSLKTSLSPCPQMKGPQSGLSAAGFKRCWSPILFFLEKIQINIYI